MGSFSSTDAVTRLPITRGEPVLLVHYAPYFKPADAEPGEDIYPTSAASTSNFSQEMTQQIKRERRRSAQRREVAERFPEYADDLGALTLMLRTSGDSDLEMLAYELRRPDEWTPYLGVIGTYDDYGWITLADGAAYNAGQVGRDEDAFRQAVENARRKAMARHAGEEPEPEGSQEATPPEQPAEEQPAEEQPAQRRPHDGRVPATHCFFVKLKTMSELFLNSEPLTEHNKVSAMASLADFCHGVRVQLFGNTHGLLGRQDPDDCEYAEQRLLQAVIARQLDELESEALEQQGFGEQGAELFGETAEEAVAGEMHTSFTRSVTTLDRSVMGPGVIEVGMTPVSVELIRNVLRRFPAFDARQTDGVPEPWHFVGTLFFKKKNHMIVAADVSTHSARHASGDQNITG